jgi:hypothetical protein
MNTELEDAARLLEAKSVGDGPPLERYPAEIWQFIEQRLPGYGPAWYRDLTQRFRIGGAEFRFPLDERRYIGNCGIVRPSTALCYVYAGWPLPDLLAQGFFCFADGDDGNVWMFRNDAVSDPPVYFLEMTAWDGATVSPRNGLFSPPITLSQLLRHGAAWIPDPK